MSRFKFGAFITVVALALMAILASDVLAAGARYVYVGTYSAPNFAPGAKSPSLAEGIYIFKMDQAQGSLALVKAVKAENPTFLTIDPAMKYLYCINEMGADDKGNPLGRVSAYKIDPASGDLIFINTQLTQGTFPCHLWVHPSGKYLFVANYGSGNFAVYPLQGDGSIGRMTDFVQDAANGTGPEKARQEGPHAHMILTNPRAQHVFGVDLGADKVMAWNFDLSSGKLSPGEVPFANVASGAGCRHMVFHPNDKFAYVLNELNSTINVFNFDPIRGAFIVTQTLSTLPADTKYNRPVFDPASAGKVPANSNTTAEIRIHPNGKWVYSTNRGANTVAMYSVDPKSGKLTLMGEVPSQGEIPRGMNIDPSGNFLYVGNQDSDNILVFRINSQSGRLEGPLQTIKSPVPVDFVFGPAL